MPEHKQPQGRWKKDWQPYAVSPTTPNRRDAEGGRDMSLLDSLAVRDAIERQANLAHLSEPERSVLSAVLHETWRYGRLTASASHSYLSRYANRGPRKMGEPLVSLEHKGFIAYTAGTSTKSVEGHRQTHSVIRPLIPAGWERFRDGGWREAEDAAAQVAQAAQDGPQGAPAAVPSTPAAPSVGHEQLTAPGVGLPVAVESPSTPGGSRSPRPSGREREGLGVRESKVSESESSNSRTPRGEGLGVRESKVSDSGAQSGRLERGGYDGEVKAGETNAPPLALRAQTQTIVADPPPTERMVGPLLQPPLIDSSWEPPDILRLLRSTLTAQGHQVLTNDRAQELCAGIAQLRADDPSVTDAEAVYLVGLWCGDRQMRNANHFPDHARRHRSEAAGLADLLEDEPAKTWLAWGNGHGTECRASRTEEKRRRSRALSV